MWEYCPKALHTSMVTVDAGSILQMNCIEGMKGNDTLTLHNDGKFLKLTQYLLTRVFPIFVVITHSLEVLTEYLLRASTMLLTEDEGAAALLMGLWQRQKPRLRESRLVVVR